MAAYKTPLTTTGYQFVQERFAVRPYTPRQLYTMYGVSDKTFRKWLEPFCEEIGQKKGRYYTINQVMIILQRLGIPGDIIID